MTHPRETEVTIEGIVALTMTDNTGKIRDATHSEFLEFIEHIADYLYSDPEPGIANQVIWGQAQTGAVTISFTVHGSPHVPNLIHRMIEAAGPNLGSKLDVVGPAPAEHYRLVSA